MSTDTGGPAFPYVCDADFDYGTGMTLRDYFAAKAMQSLVHQNYYEVAAKQAYEMADAMLKAREA